MSVIDSKFCPGSKRSNNQSRKYMQRLSNRNRRASMIVKLAARGYNELPMTIYPFRNLCCDFKGEVTGAPVRSLKPIQVVLPLNKITSPFLPRILPQNPVKWKAQPLGNEGVRPTATLPLAELS